MCTNRDIGELFLGKPDELVLAYDEIEQVISQWKPFSAGASVHSIVIASEKAWLIIKPMKAELDVKFYHDTIIDSPALKRVVNYGAKAAHHLRVKSPENLTDEVFRLLRMGFEYSLK